MADIDTVLTKTITAKILEANSERVTFEFRGVPEEMRQRTFLVGDTFSFVFPLTLKGIINDNA